MAATQNSKTFFAGLDEAKKFHLRKRFIMKSFLFPKLSNLLLFACSAVVLGSNVMSAQVSRGNFTLPVETHWGPAVMGPGSYSYTLDREPFGLVISVIGEGKSVRIPAAVAVSSRQPFQGSTLMLITHEGETSVRSMQFGHLGVTLEYKAPKTPSMP